MKRVILLFVICSGFIMNASTENLNQYMPKSVNGWFPSGLDRYYYPETLFDYANGEAELFRSYGFKQVISRRYRRSGQPDILVEIFDMVEAKNAFGVFTHARETIDERYGQGSQSFQGAILFWKDRYYVSIVSNAETSEIKKALPAMAKKISKAIREEGTLPQILQWIPEEDLVPESVFYFHHYVWLNAFYYISDDNFLNIYDETDAILAKYGTADSRYYLLVIQYPDEQKAEKAYNSFTTHYAPEIQNDPVVKVKDEKWIGAVLDHELFIAVLNGPEEKSVSSLLEAARHKHSGSTE